MYAVVQFETRPCSFSYLFHIISISLEGLVYVPTPIFPTSSSARSLLHGPLSDINHDYALHYQLDGSKRLDRVVKWLAVCVLSVMLACESEGSHSPARGLYELHMTWGLRRESMRDTCVRAVSLF